MCTAEQLLAPVAARILRRIPSHRSRKRYAKRVGPFFEGCIANTAYGFPMVASWHDNVNRIGFEGSYGLVENFIMSMPADVSYIDIGANQGFTSIMASKRLTGGMVSCYEPSRHSFDMLLKNIALNGCTNIRAVNMAVSQERQSLFLNETNAGNSGAHHIGNEGETIRAGPIDLNSVWNPLRFSGIFVKIDTEGYELGALRGLAEVLASGFVRKVVVEINANHLARYGATPEQVYAYLGAFGLEPEHGLCGKHYDEIFSTQRH